MSRSPVCSNCRKRPVDPLWRPFCSERCKLLDLGRWIDGAYRIPGEPVPDVAPDAGDADDSGKPPKE